MQYPLFYSENPTGAYATRVFGAGAPMPRFRGGSLTAATKIAQKNADARLETTFQAIAHASPDSANTQLRRANNLGNVGEFGKSMERRQFAQAHGSEIMAANEISRNREQGYRPANPKSAAVTSGPFLYKTLYDTREPSIGLGEQSSDLRRDALKDVRLRSRMVAPQFPASWIPTWMIK